MTWCTGSPPRNRPPSRTSSPRWRSSWAWTRFLIRTVLRAQVHDRLRSVPGWLLVFDNADAVDDIRAWLPGGPLPPGIPGHVIVTTRRGGFAALGRVMELDVIDLAAAVTLLRTRVPDLPRTSAQEIAEELGRLPLALEQAAAYLDRSAMPPGTTWACCASGPRICTRGARSADATTRSPRCGTSPSSGSAARTRPRCVLLDLCAYLAPEPIPLDLFTRHADLLPEPLAAAAADQLAFNEVIGTLVDYSLAKRTQTGLQLHRLVQGVIRARHQHARSSPAPADS